MIYNFLNLGVLVSLLVSCTHRGNVIVVEESSEKVMVLEKKVSELTEKAKFPPQTTLDNALIKTIVATELAGYAKENYVIDQINNTEAKYDAKLLEKADNPDVNAIKTKLQRKASKLEIVDLKTKLNTKADKIELNQYAKESGVDEKIVTAKNAIEADYNLKLENKADKSEISVLDTKLANKADTSELKQYIKSSEVNEEIATVKHEIETDYNLKLDNKADKSEISVLDARMQRRASKLEIFDIKIELDKKANKADLNTKADKAEVLALNTKLADKPDKALLNEVNRESKKGMDEMLQICAKYVTKPELDLELETLYRDINSMKSTLNSIQERIQKKGNLPFGEIMGGW